jgi:hypothetical protein
VLHRVVQVGLWFGVAMVAMHAHAKQCSGLRGYSYGLTYIKKCYWLFPCSLQKALHAHRAYLDHFCIISSGCAAQPLLHRVVQERQRCGLHLVAMHRKVYVSITTS